MKTSFRIIIRVLMEIRNHVNIAYEPAQAQTQLRPSQGGSWLGQFVSMSHLTKATLNPLNYLCAAKAELSRSRELVLPCAAPAKDCGEQSGCKGAQANDVRVSDTNSRRRFCEYKLLSFRYS